MKILNLIIPICFLILVFSCSKDNDFTSNVSTNSNHTNTKIVSYLSTIRTINLSESEFAIGKISPARTYISDIGNIFLYDQKNRAYFMYDSVGNFQNMIGKKGKGPGELTEPTHLTTDIKNNIYVFDESKSSTIVYDNNNNFLKEIKYNKGYPVPGSLVIKNQKQIISLIENTGDNFFEDVNLLHILDENLIIKKPITVDFPKYYKKLNLMNYIFIDWQMDENFIYILFPAIPNIYKYNFNGELFAVFDLFAEDFKTIDTRLERITDPTKKRKIISQYSFGSQCFLFRENYLVCTYFNQPSTTSNEFNPFSKDTRIWYYQIIMTNGAVIKPKTSKLPGKPLQCTSDGKLYVLLSDEPENRKIGVYEIVLEDI